MRSGDPLSLPTLLALAPLVTTLSMRKGGVSGRFPSAWGTPDFKSPSLISVYLGGSEFFLLTKPIRRSNRLRHLGLSRRVSLPP